MNRKFEGWTIVVLGLISASASASTETKKPPVVFVQKMQLAELYDDLSYPARVVPTINTVLLSESDGVVSRIFAPLGERVKKGQKLLSVTHTDPVYQYAPWIITAPVSGIVSAMEVSVGTQVSKGQRLTAVTDPVRMKLTVEVPAQDLSSLSRGLRGEFRLPGTEAAHPIRIQGLSPFVDPASGTAACEIELLANDVGNEGPMPALPALAPGMMGKVSFRLNTHKGFSIPEYAIVYKGSETFIRLVDSGKSKKVPVKLGKRARGQIEVLEGLSENAVLIERSSRFIGDGEEVSVESDAQGS